jgi:hypothetical protein
MATLSELLLTTNSKSFSQKIGGFVIGKYQQGKNYTFGFVSKPYGSFIFQPILKNNCVYIEGAKSYCLANIKNEIPFIQIDNTKYYYHRRYDRWFKDIDLNKYFTKNFYV